MATTQPGGSWAHQPTKPSRRNAPARYHSSLCIDRVDLQHALGQIDADAHDFPVSTASCNLLHGLLPSMA